ncbi:PfkB family carbohydrate kinase [Oceanicola sp. S124]|uniref:PfkB family carbohydrate kinase n=1 Tax=Oceanicola sp. S124 TaxID=1042378 RepID=UPI0002558554|nr:PfkB family carbohydrate kinase [Oceanicola sp. S124]
MIISVGSLNADLICRVAEVPAAGQSIAARGFPLEAGGKGGNQAVAAAREGAEVLKAGAVGHDPLARGALRTLQGEGIDLSHVRTLDAPTGTATIFVDDAGLNRITISHGANTEAQAGALGDDLLRGASTVLLQLEIPVTEVGVMVLRCADLGARTILNLAPARAVPHVVLRAAGLLVVNEDEADSLAAGLGCAPTAMALSAALGTDVRRTMGGAEAACDGTLPTVEALPVDAIDTIAGSHSSLPRAGDTDRLVAV